MIISILRNRTLLNFGTRQLPILLSRPFNNSYNLLLRTSMATQEAQLHVASMGDLNNTDAARVAVSLRPDPSYLNRTLEIPASEDDPEVRKAYRPFLLSSEVIQSDWVSKLELSTVMKMAEQELERSDGNRLKVLVLYGSMRSR